jgi:hypothetical protein
MPADAINELTFAGWLAEFTGTRAQRCRDEGEVPLIASGEIEERQLDADGRVRRCDLRFNSPTGRKLASGELKKPEVQHGRDPRNENLRADARRKALARGLPFYFTCNMATVVLFAIADAPGQLDREIAAFELAPISRSSQAAAYRDKIAAGWTDFLDALESQLSAFAKTRPTVTTDDVIAIRNAIFAVADEVLPRAERRVKEHPDIAEDLRNVARRSFNFGAALEARYPDKFREELSQMLRFGAFVVAQKLVLYRVLQDAGPRRTDPFQLDELSVPEVSTDPQAVRAGLDRAFSPAIPVAYASPTSLML